jgi:putative SbcD/Mre11-related phosphoesterase
MPLIEELEIGGGRVISNHRCLFDRETGTLAVADLHLGYEGAAKDDGVYFPRFQMDEMVKDLVLVLERYRPERVVINGDLKHTFDRNLYQEWQEIKEVFGLLSGKVPDVRIVKGNHDNFIAGILPKGTELPLMFWTGRLQFTHGHKKDALGEGRAEGKILVLGHEHPSVLLKDKVGAAVKLPCFLYHPEAGILILPAFSRMTRGSSVLNRGFLSKILKEYQPGEFMAYATSEIGLMEMGRLGNLEGPHDRIP